MQKPPSLGTSRTPPASLRRLTALSRHQALDTRAISDLCGNTCRTDLLAIRAEWADLGVHWILG
jgi:hypothetical protein